jgi:hypothetical protein
MVSLAQVQPEQGPDSSELLLLDLPWCDARAANYPLTEEEAAWCDLPVSARCPGLQQACAAPRAELSTTGSRNAENSVGDQGDEGSGNEDSGNEGSAKEGRENEGSGNEGGGLTTESPEPPEVTESIAEENSVLTVIRRVLFGIVLLALIALMVAMIRGARRGSSEGSPSESDSEQMNGPTASSSSAIGARAASNAGTPPQTWVDLAASASQRGEHREAWTCLATALLLALQANGRVQLHPSRTTGDYVRRAPDQDTAALLRVVLRSAEAAHYGGQIPPEETLAWALAEVRAQDERRP